MNLKILKLFFLATVAGIILRISDYAIAYALIKSTGELSAIANTVGVILSIVAVVIIGMKLRKEYDRKMFIKAATVLVVYSIVIFTIERIAQYFNSYSLITYRLCIPTEMFFPIDLLLMQINIAGIPTWVLFIPSLFAPYLFVLFGKKSTNSNSDVLSI
ncbi:hypothetical protein SDC9_144370 [bioreactor metagenome]|uniref:Uncharacterized protein n=1 Tax=bioreactor metagenome TaxID=1076179 RepID=A0A645E622_9ZZZZ|nr:hypothetical protein [Candidatus Metalachnospira sp.]